MKSRLLLNVVVRKSAAIFELLTSKNKTLLVRGNAFLVLDLLLHSLDGVRGLDLKGDGLSGEGLHKNLHTTTETEDQMEGRLLLNVVVRKSAAIFELLTSKNKTLLVRGNTFLVLDLLLHGLDGIKGLDLEGDGLSGEGFDEDLHGCCWSVRKKGKVVVVGTKGILVVKEVAKRWCKLTVFVERGNLTETHFSHPFFLSKFFRTRREKKMGSLSFSFSFSFSLSNKKITVFVFVLCFVYSALKDGSPMF